MNNYVETALAFGAKNAAIVAVDEIELEAKFRELCASNACGMYGRCWTCPPDIGEIDALMEKLRSYRSALVYQTIFPLEDSFDFEGMMEAGRRHNELVQKLRKEIPEGLHLGAGGCKVCSPCAKHSNEPCRFPDRAIASLEAHGVNVSKLAQLAGMKYINGADTVTYFGAVFFE
ncbi:MAG: DUF2284 domain-containing protein [Clostridia bacterium]|nr:DUF2284 domain-containing protein [Clostridia bacterium]